MEILPPASCCTPLEGWEMGAALRASLVVPGVMWSCSEVLLQLDGGEKL